MMNETKILLIEPDLLVRHKIMALLRAAGFESVFEGEPSITVSEVEVAGPDAAVLGPSLGRRVLGECIHKLKILNVFMPILVLGGKGKLPGSTEDMAFEGVHILPVNPAPDAIHGILREALEEEKIARESTDMEFPILVGGSRAISEIRKKIRRVADKDITVLITGESGTGKELIARSIHRYSLRRSGPLVKINCSALPDDLLESEIFGFQKGAFTGAHQDKPGRFELADGGTLFIDEIGDLSLPLQVKLLQVLEEKVFSRLGDTRDKVIDARVVAATNSNLEQKVREGEFRKDLFYRLDVARIHAPLLRERREDIPILTHYFLNKYCYEFRKELLDVPSEVVDYLRSYGWPGNVRELENVVRRAIVLRDWRFIFQELEVSQEEPDDQDKVPYPDGGVFPELWDDEKLMNAFKDEDFSLKKITKEYISEAESKAILEALKKTQWNRKKAAALLKVSYKTLLNRIDEFGLTP
ncbi:MAG: sigma-54-dependent Fis family transcriptional regulator [Deltaproteobacteria bacterium]|nr:sigma-54-dependent Fis family transcriptional regulator [Deltaproteobacteria bacterium]